jgi:serine protease Do
MKAGDAITKLNGQEIKNAGDLTRRIGSMKPGDKVELSYLRGGAEKTTNAALALQKSEKTGSAEPSQNPPAPGLQLAPGSPG